MDSKKSKTENQKTESINPAAVSGNYLVEIKSNGRVIKQVAALNATVNILNIKDVPAAFDIK